MDLIKKTLLDSLDLGDKTDISCLTIEQIENLVLHDISTFCKNKIVIAFFFPNHGFANNLGNLDSYLIKEDMEVIYLLGDCDFYSNFSKKNKWFICNDMISRLSGPKGIVTCSVMDCIPKNIKHFLNDHISFAHTEMDQVIYELNNFKRKDFESLNILNKKSLFEKVSAFISYLPFYDVVFVNNKFIYQTSANALKLLGYRERKNGYFVKKKINFNNHLKKIINKFVSVKDFRKEIRIKIIGYLKLDKEFLKLENNNYENIIVFAPTPLDKSGNKSGTFWEKLILNPSASVELLKFLCNTYKNYKIYYKPYKDENLEKLRFITSNLINYKNFYTSEVGDNYWSLYKSAKLLVTDASSTAYTFSMGVEKPVLFYSPNDLDIDIKDNIYMKHRENIGLIASNIDQVSLCIEKIFEQYNEYRNKIINFKKDIGINSFDNIAKNASEIIKENIS